MSHFVLYLLHFLFCPTHLFFSIPAVGFSLRRFAVSPRCGRSVSLPSDDRLTKIK
jgi:hypothetical protein